MRIESNWLIPHRSNPLMTLHDRELHLVSLVAIVMIGIALASATVLLFRGTLFALNGRQSSQRIVPLAGLPAEFDRRWWIVLALIPAIVLFLVTPASLPVWNLLPKLRYLQFPWRWLMVVEAPMAILIAAALWTAGRTSRLRRSAAATVYTFFLLATTVFAVQNFFRADHREDRLPNIVAAATSTMGLVGTDEYAPLGADNSIVAKQLPDACLVDDFDRELGVAASPEDNPVWRPGQASCVATATAAIRAPDHFHVAVTPAGAGFLILRLRSYPAWRITVNGRLLTDLPSRTDGLIAIPVSASSAAHVPIEVAADWTTTGDIILGRGLSVASLLLLIVIGTFERRNLQAPR